MLVNFSFRGADCKALVQKTGDKELEVMIVDDFISRQFGHKFEYRIGNRTVDFTPLNLCHSDLYAFQCEIRKAIDENKVLKELNLLFG